MVSWKRGIFLKIDIFAYNKHDIFKTLLILSPVVYHVLRFGVSSSSTLSMYIECELNVALTSELKLELYLYSKIYPSPSFSLSLSVSVLKRLIHCTVSRQE